MENIDAEILEKLNIEDEAITKLLLSENVEDYLVGLELCKKYTNFEDIRLICCAQTSYINEEDAEYWRENRDRYYKIKDLYE